MKFGMCCIGKEADLVLKLTYDIPGMVSHCRSHLLAIRVFDT